MIPKEGGNQFAGSLSGLFSNDNLMSDNLSDELIARGLKSVNRLNYIYDAGFTLGGPIKRDRLWFYGSFREWGNKRQAANKFYNATQHTPVYTPDLTRPAFAKEWYESKAIRLTWRVVGKEQVQLLRRSAARLPLPGAHRERIGERAGGVFQLQAQASGSVSGDVELTPYQQAAARSRRWARRWKLADLPSA